MPDRAGLLVAVVLVPGDVRTAGEFALAYFVALLAIAAAAAVFFWFARDNYLAYAAILWVLALRGPLSELYGNARPIHFWTLTAILLAGVAWAFLPVFGAKARQA